MRFVVILALLTGTLASAGCGGRQFDIVRTAILEVSAGDDLSQMHFAALTPLTLLDDTLLRAQGVGRGDLNQVQLRRMTLTVLTPGSSQDFSFVTSMTAVMRSPNLAERTLAGNDAFEAHTNLAVLNVVPSPLIDYFSQGDPTVAVMANGAVAPQNMTLRAELTFVLEVSSSKILIE